MKRMSLIVAAMLGMYGAGGCGSEKAAAPVETTTAVFNAVGAPTVEFSVPDMMCEDSCVPEVRKILASQPGVKDVKVELADKTATVAVDKDKFDVDAAIAALVDVQFKNTTLKAGAGGAAKATN